MPNGRVDFAVKSTLYFNLPDYEGEFRSLTAAHNGGFGLNFIEIVMSDKHLRRLFNFCSFHTRI